jgi:hypothetical protein
LRYEFGGILAGFVGHAIGLAGDEVVGAEPVALLGRLLLEERDLPRTIHAKVALALQLSHGFVHVEVLGLRIEVEFKSALARTVHTRAGARALPHTHTQGTLTAHMGLIAERSLALVLGRLALGPAELRAIHCVIVPAAGKVKQT